MFASETRLFQGGADSLAPVSGERRNGCLGQLVNVGVAGAGKLDNPDRDKLDQWCRAGQTQSGANLPERDVHYRAAVIFGHCLIPTT
jgi:hypothetical protein